MLFLRTFAAKAMHLETNCPVLSTRVVIMPNLHLSMKATRPSTFSRRLTLSCLFFSLYGSAGLLPVSALLKDDILEEVAIEDIENVLVVVNLGFCRILNCVSGQFSETFVVN